MSYYSFPDCFVKNITHTQTETPTSSRPRKRVHPSKRNRTIHLSFSIHPLYSWGFLFFWLFSATSQKVIFHPATLPVLQLAQWQINPVGLLWALCLQMARWCWWGTLVYWSRVRGRSYRVWVIVTLSWLWNAGEKCEEWMSQRHGNKNKGEAA